MKYKAGETITLREWEAMKRQYGEGSSCSIRTPMICVTLGMYKYCGRKAKIVSVHSDNYGLDIDKREFIWTDDMIAHNFTYGEKIEVWNDRERIEKRIFTSLADGGLFPFRCVDFGHEQKFKDGNHFSTSGWVNARKIEEPVIDIKITMNGKLMNPADISEETWMNLRK